MTAVLTGLAMMAGMILAVMAFGFARYRQGQADAKAAMREKTLEVLDAEARAAVAVARKPVVDSLRDGTF